VATKELHRPVFSSGCAGEAKGTWPSVKHRLTNLTSKRTLFDHCTLALVLTLRKGLRLYCQLVYLSCTKASPVSSICTKPTIFKRSTNSAPVDFAFSSMFLLVSGPPETPPHFVKILIEFFGGLSTVRRYVGSALRIVLTSSLRPPWFKSLPCQQASLLDAYGCRCTILRRPIVTGNPK
jgi:hypothetical protein